MIIHCCLAAASKLIVAQLEVEIVGVCDCWGQEQFILNDAMSGSFEKLLLGEHIPLEKCQCCA